jgi:DNA sulfur modification protein DndD
MKIKSIALNNYRLYKGLNKVDLPNGNNKNLYLISGENGFGKTTFLHSLLWCLYELLTLWLADQVSAVVADEHKIADKALSIAKRKLNKL